MSKQKDWEAVAGQEAPAELEETKAEPVDDEAASDKESTDPESDFMRELQATQQELDDAEAKRKLQFPNVKALQDATREAEDKAAQYWDKLLRTTSELENTRRRAERDVENAHKFAIEKFVDELIPVIDSLEQTIEHIDEDDDGHHSQGVKLTLKMFLDALEKFGVTPVAPVGEPFDPHRHEAMSMQEDPSAEPNTVIAVFQKGYVLNDRVVRPARVVVAKSPSQEAK